MTCVVTEPCINCVYSECLDVCPADAFHRGPNFMVINPQVCINCTLCELACPTEAIKSDYALVGEERSFIELNAELSKSGRLRRRTYRLIPKQIIGPQWPVSGSCWKRSDPVWAIRRNLGVNTLNVYLSEHSRHIRARRVIEELDNSIPTDDPSSKRKSPFASVCGNCVGSDA